MGFANSVVPSLNPILKPERRPVLKPRRAYARHSGVAPSTEAIELSSGETEPHARSHHLYIILCSHRSLRYRPTNGLFRHFFSRTCHHSICSVACLAADRPIAPCRMDRRNCELVCSGLASTFLTGSATASCGSVVGRHHTYVVPAARSPRNARLAAEAAVHVRDSEASALRRFLLPLMLACKASPVCGHPRFSW